MQCNRTAARGRFSRVAKRLVPPMIVATTAGMFAGTASAEINNAFRLLLTINNAPALNVSGGNPNAPVAESRTLTQSGVTASLSASANVSTAAKAAVSGSSAAKAISHAATQFGFVLNAPAGADVRGGKLIFHALLEGTVAGDADLHMVTTLQFDAATGHPSAALTIADAATSRGEFDLASDIAPWAVTASLKGLLRVYVDATARLAGGASASASAEASNNTRITGFRVLNSAGAQVSGFTMTVDGGGSIPETSGGTGGGGKAVAVEFFNAGFGHYFVTANATEIAKLDNGTFAGWTRTGRSFNVAADAGSGRLPVCRFFTVAFPPTSSHFYAPRGLGCEGTLANPRWQFEGDVFFTALPNAAGTCPAGTIPIYRLYNQGQGGAPNHRFTTDEAVRTQMISAGWIAEGAGIGVGMCSPQ